VIGLYDKRAIIKYMARYISFKIYVIWVP